MLYMTQNIQDDTQDSHSEDSQSNDQGGEERNTGFGSGKSNSEGSEGYSDNEQDF